MSLTLTDIKNILQPKRFNATPTDDFRILNSWTEYSEGKNKALDYLCYEMEIINPETGDKKHLYKAIRFCRVIRLPKSAKQSTSLMDMHTQVLTAMYENEVNMITVIANIIKPVPLGLLYLYGAQGVAETMDDAKAKAHADFVRLTAVMQGTYRTLSLQIITQEETEWLREKLYDMQYMTTVRGIPFASKTGEDAGNKGFGGKNINPDSQGTLEEMILGMSDYEYIIQVLSTPVFMKTLKDMCFKTEKQMTEWYSQMQGQQSLSMGVSIPMVYAANAGSSNGWSHNYTNANSVNYSTGENFSTSVGENVGQSLTNSFGQSFSQSSSHSIGTSSSESIGSSQTLGTSSGNSLNMSQGMSENSGLSQGQSLNTSEGVNSGSSFSVGSSSGTSMNHSLGSSENSSVGTSESASESSSNSFGTSHSDSSSLSMSDSHSSSESTGSSWNHGTSNSVSEGNSWGSNVGSSSGTNQGSNIGNSSNAGVNASIFGIGGNGSYGSSNGSSLGSSLGDSLGLSSGGSAGQSSGFSDGYGGSMSASNSESYGSSASSGVSDGFSTSTSESTSLSHGMSSSQSVGSSESFSTGNSNSISESYGSSLSTSSSNSIGSSVGLSQSSGTSESISQGQNVGTSQSIGQSFSKSMGTSTSDSTSVSAGTSNSTSQGVSTGQSTSNSTGQSYSSGTGESISNSLGSSGSTSAGVSSSMGLGPSISYSKSHQWLDQQVKDIIALLEFSNNRLKRALAGNGAFYTYVYIATETMDGLSAAQALAKSTWQNEFAIVSPLQVLNLSEEEQEHLLYHFAAFSSDVTKEDVYGVKQYKYCTILLPDEFVAYNHLPRVSEGGVAAEVNDIPHFYCPSMLKGEIYLGNVLNAERCTMEHGYSTPFDYRIDESELMHGFITAASRSGKTVAAMRFIAELAHVKRKKTGKRLRIVCLDPKRDWRGIAKFVEPERFRFYSLGNTKFRPIHLNPWKVPYGVNPQIWVDGVIDIYCRSYGLLERGKQMIGDIVYSLYDRAGVFDALNKENWKELVPALSAKVCFRQIYDEMAKKRDKLGGKDAKVKTGFDTMDAYARLLERLSTFSRKYSIESQLFGNDDGMGVDEMIGNDDVTVLESKGLENTFKNFIFGVITSGFYKFAIGHENGYLAPDQYETVLVIEEANEILTGNTDGKDMSVPGQSEFEQMLDQAAGYGLFIFAITQRISLMPPSIIANAGIKMIGRLNDDKDIEKCIYAIGREPKFEDRELFKWIPKSPIGTFICQSSRGFDFVSAEPVLVKIAPLNVPSPSNSEIDEILMNKEIKDTLANIDAS